MKKILIILATTMITASLYSAETGGEDIYFRTVKNERHTYLYSNAPIWRKLNDWYGNLKGETFK